MITQKQADEAVRNARRAQMIHGGRYRATVLHAVRDAFGQALSIDGLISLLQYVRKKHPDPQIAIICEESTLYMNGGFCGPLGDLRRMPVEPEGDFRIKVFT